MCSCLDLFDSTRYYSFILCVVIYSLVIGDLSPGICVCVSMLRTRYPRTVCVCLCNAFWVRVVGVVGLETLVSLLV